MSGSRSRGKMEGEGKEYKEGIWKEWKVGEIKE